MVAFKSAGTVFKSGNGSPVSTFTANVPTGAGAPSSGDLLLAVGVDWAGSGVTWTTPTGWTSVRNDNDGGTGDIGIHVYRKIAGASEANQNFTLSTAEDGVMVMLCYSSPNSTTPIDVSGANVTDPSTATSTLTTPSVTTTQANDVLLLIYAVGSDSNGSTTNNPTFTTPTGATNRVAASGVQDAGGNWVCFAIDDIAQASAGASAQYSSTSGNNATSTYGAGAVVVALTGSGSSFDPTTLGQVYGITDAGLLVPFFVLGGY
jgi:hypothetical protein